MPECLDEFVLSDRGPGRASAQFELSDGWDVPMPLDAGPVRNAHEPHWSATPLGPEDAAGAVIGARTGLWVPVSDQAPGRYGTDAKRMNRNDRDLPDIPLDLEEW